MALDWSTLGKLAGLTDEIGVLSVYVTVDPHHRVEQGAAPPWQLRVRHDLTGIQERARQAEPRERWKALAARLAELEPDLDRLGSPTSTGQGRALFAPLSAGAAVTTVSLQVPLMDRAVIEPRAHVRPLVAAWSTAGPAGIAAVGADGVRVVDLRFGLTEELTTIGYESPVEQRQLKGPAAGNPAMAQQTASQHDLYERREDDKLVRFLRTVGVALAGLAKEREWGYLAVAGEAPLVRAVMDGLPATLPAEVVPVDQTATSMSPPKLAAAVTPALDRARQRRHRELAAQACDLARSGGTGTCGLGDTLGALREGRVAHLLLDPDRQWTGRRAPDGRLAPAGEVPPGADPAGLVEEPHLGERMLEQALDTSAEVTFLAGDAVAPLADSDGVAALTRW